MDPRRANASPADSAPGCGPGIPIATPIIADLAAACGFPNVKLHLYGKLQARKGRKMGHLTALAATPEAAAERVLAARRALTDRSGATEEL